MMTQHEKPKDKGDREVSREEAEACAWERPVLAGMIRRGVRLTRNNYLIRAGLSDRDPGSWTTVDELSLPLCFQDADAVKPDSGKKDSRHLLD